MATIWKNEPPTKSERHYTPWGGGWRCWNGKAPEKEFCEFVGSLVGLIKPRYIIETGVGVGFTTRRIIKSMSPKSNLYLFESDPNFRRVISANVDNTKCDICNQNPTPEHWKKCDLAVLDSVTTLRLKELQGWASYSKPGSICVIHDCSFRHSENTIHRKIFDRVWNMQFIVSVLFLPNPRGSALLQKPLGQYIEGRVNPG